MKKINLLTAAYLLFNLTTQAQLSGTYTIGGTSPNYTTLDSAVAHLESVGVSGAVTFRIRQGTYTTQITLDSVAGTSPSNTVTFRPDPANTSDVWIQYSSNSSSLNYVWKFNGSDYIRMENLKFKSLSSTYSRIIDYSLLTNNIIIDSCTLYNAYTGTSSSTANASVFHNTGTANRATNCTVKNSFFTRGNTGVYLYGISTSNRESGNRIENNRFDSVGNYGIYSYSQDSVSIHNNLITGIPGFSAAQYGIFLNYNNYKSEVTGNQIYLSNTNNSYGIYFQYSTGSAIYPIRIHNNMISLMGTGTSIQYGLYDYDGTYRQVYYNSIRVAGTSSSSRAVQLGFGSNVTYKNNILMAAGAGYAFYISTAPSNVTSDYNCLYTNGSNLGYLGSPISTIAAWRSTSSQDANSINVDPAYDAPNDLHVSSAALDSAATPIANITTDIDGQSRNATFPDIGADEFAPPACPKPTGLNVNKISSDSAVISWTTGGATRWNLEWDTIGYTRGTGTILKNLTTTSYGIGGLIMGASYDVYVQDSCGSGNGSSVWSKITFNMSYCQSFATSAGDTKIDSVFISGKTFGSSPSACETYTARIGIADVIQMNRGNSYNLKVLNGSCGSHYGAYVKAWIDFDGNLTYNDTSELVMVMTSTTTGIHNAIISNVSVPLTAVLGKVGMRVVIRESSQPTSCGTYSYGETEDYMIEILPAPPCPSPSSFNATFISSDSIALGWTTGGATSWNLEWDTVGFVRGNGTRINNINTTSYGIGGLSLGGVYDFYVQDTCGGGNGSSAWIKLTVNIMPCASNATSSIDTKLDSVFFAGRSFGSSNSACETYTARLSASDEIPVVAGYSYPLRVVNGSCGSHYGAYVSAWIDFNGNLQFDASEQVFRMNSPTTGLQMAGLDTMVKIPATASGKILMRIIIRESSQPIACGTFGYGETEDYMLHVQPTCNSYATYAWDTKIDSVFFAGRTFGSSPSVCENYTAYKSPSDVINVQKGTSSILKVLNGSCSFSHYGAYVKAWIDFNKDGQYSSTEEVLTMTSTTSGLGQTNILNSVAIPLSAAAGITGMRVIIRESSQPTSCGTYLYGETEDFLVNIMPPPPCPSPSGLTATVNRNDSITLAWTTGGATAWNLEWDTIGFTVGTGTRINNLNTTTYGIGGLSLGGVYDFYVQDTCGGGNGSSPWIKVTSGPNYCTSTATSTADTKIDSVFISSKTFGSTPSACETYTARTSAADVIQMNRGNTYILKVLNGSCGGHYSAYVKAWIDFDGNLNYNDTSELVMVMSSATTGIHNAIISNVSVPLTAVLGKVGMRVVIRESSQPTSCGTYSYGETEDYMVEILPAAACPQPSSLTGTVVQSDSIVFSWVTGGASAWNIEYDTTNFVRGTGMRLNNLTSTTFGAGGLTLGRTYDFYVQDTCGGSNGASPWTKLTIRLDYCQSSANNSADTKLDSVQFGTRTFGSSGTTCESYTSRRSSSDIMTVRAGTTQYLRVLNGSCSNYHYGAYVSAWIDFNGNMQYDSTEQVLRMTSPTTGLQQVIDTLVQIPLNAAGLRGMRVIIRESGQPLACGTFSYGETEDYLLNILPPPSYDAGIIALTDSICPSGDSLFAVFKNYGTTSLAQVTINWEISVNGGAFTANTPVAWMGTLPKDSIATVFLGVQTFNPQHINRIRVFTSSPNGNTDEITINDTLNRIMFVRNNPTIVFNLGGVCLNATVFAPSATPSGGIWSGSGIYGGLFYPDTATTGPGNYYLFYSYTDTFGCNAIDSAVQRVDTLPVVSLSAFAGICRNSPAITLTQGNPAGGIYAGAGVSSGTFNPAVANSGFNTITYTFTDAHNCSATATDSMEVYTAPVVIMGTLSSLCENAAAINLITGLPAGGNYSGPGISLNRFDPAAVGAGTFSITYHYTDANLCSDSASTGITVLAAPNVSMGALTPVCDNGGNVALSGGLPTGGTYRGTYVSGSTFLTDSAGVGSHTVTYSYTNTDNCSDSIFQIQVVEASPVFNLGNDTTICGKQKLVLTPGLSAMNYQWSTGDTTQTIEVRTSGTYSIVVTDPATFAGCKNRDTIVVRYEAECTGVAESLAAIADISYFPNPNNGSFTLRITGLEGLNAKLFVTDATGRLITSMQFEQLPAIFEQPVLLQNAATGVYYLNLVTEKGSAAHIITIRR